MIIKTDQTSTSAFREYKVPPTELREYKEAALPTNRHGTIDLPEIPTTTMKSISWLMSLNQRARVFSAEIPSKSNLIGNVGSLTISELGIDRMEIIHIRAITPSEKARIENIQVGLKRSHLVIDRDGAIINGCISDHYDGRDPQHVPLTKGNFLLTTLLEDISEVAKRKFRKQGISSPKT